MGYDGLLWVILLIWKKARMGGKGKDERDCGLSWVRC